MKSQKSKKKFGKSQNSENLEAQRLKTQKSKKKKKKEKEIMGNWRVGKTGKCKNSYMDVWKSRNEWRVFFQEML